MVEPSITHDDAHLKQELTNEAGCGGGFVTEVVDDIIICPKLSEDKLIKPIKFDEIRSSVHDDNTAY